ncbi:hypothetical protein, partial [Escherichia coli]|uniref:hypothetical protein n=1 Tax=Escherichia coli TaxID=562 RepID=UPI003EE2676D
PEKHKTAKIPLILNVFSFSVSADHTADKHESIKRIMQGMGEHEYDDSCLRYTGTWAYLNINK